MTKTQMASRPISAIVIYSTSGEFRCGAGLRVFGDDGAPVDIQSFAQVSNNADVCSTVRTTDTLKSLPHMFFFLNSTLLYYCIIVSLCSFHVLSLCVFISKFCLQLCYFSVLHIRLLCANKNFSLTYFTTHITPQ